MEYIEITGKTVEEAITNACTKLSIPSSKLDYVVLEKGSSGFLGIGSKPAKIKAREKEELKEEVDEVKEVIKEEPKTQVFKTEKKPAKAETPKTEAVKKSETKKETPVQDASVKETSVKETSVKDTSVEDAPKVSSKNVIPESEVRARITNFLDSMFGAMNMEVKVDITFDKEEECVNIELSGDNMGVLIGKRGQTLDSIQYLTSLVLNKDSKDKYVRIKLDTENYRNRRKETLESLAKNVAYKVKRSRRPFSLEPMNPYERRIIHSALQNDKFVSTKSEGEEPFRHVVVFLDKEKPANNRYSR